MARPDRYGPATTRRSSAPSSHERSLVVLRRAFGVSVPAEWRMAGTGNLSGYGVRAERRYQISYPTFVSAVATDGSAPSTATGRGAEEADRKRIMQAEGRSRPEALRGIARALRLHHAPGASGTRRARDCRGVTATQSRRSGDGPISWHRPREREVAAPRCRNRAAFARRSTRASSRPGGRRPAVSLTSIATVTSGYVAAGLKGMTNGRRHSKCT